MKNINRSYLLLLTLSSAAIAKSSLFSAGGDAQLSGDKISVMGKDYEATKYCNSDTVGNPGMLEVFSVKNKKYSVATLCPSSKEGGANVISVYNKKTGKTKSVKPLKNATRISNTALEIAIKDLTKK
jgi:hypothetical protein